MSNYWTSDSIGTLFSSLNKGSNSLLDYTSEYNSIKSGSYGKLLKSYYGLGKAGSASGTTGTKEKQTSTLDKVLAERRKPTVSEDTSKANIAVSKGVTNLKSSIASLQKDSTYTSTEGGQSASDKALAAMKNYVTDYNNVVTSAKKSTTSGITSNVASMMKTTSANADALAEIGVTVNGNGTISLDEKKFQSADLSKVQELFSSNDAMSYGATVSSRVRGAGYYTSTAVSTTSATDSTETKRDAATSSAGLKADSRTLATDAAYKKVKDASGNETDKYDVTAITNSVKSFIQNYNDTMSTTKNSRISGVASNASYIQSKTDGFKDSLSEIGITINDDKSLTLDEEKFKNADMDKVKEVFKEYANSIATNASLVNYYVNSQADASNGYRNNAGYNVPATGSYVSTV